ncbi:hypothetical protein D9758_017315 [Tetrapyrgos nigripes]|uniref:Hydrophobin n=1 Tax=Tetrapyrgos nigripes TaxID=182062 RepID=A0A8H5BJC3_9AGAR|nr:hypothetical protein D9758_017315 [Tetrapyrgos nigripes]
MPPFIVLSDSSSSNPAHIPNTSLSALEAPAKSPQLVFRQFSKAEVLHTMQPFSVSQPSSFNDSWHNTQIDVSQGWNSGLENRASRCEKLFLEMVAATDSCKFTGPFQTYDSLIMQFKFLTVAALASLAAANPLEVRQAGQCNTGPIQCCNAVRPASDPLFMHSLRLLGIVVQDPNLPVGVNLQP